MNWRRLILAIGVVGAVVIASIVIFSIDWGGNSAIQDAIKPVNIADYSTTDVKVRMSIRGPVNNNQEHQDMQITVGRDSNFGELFSGYQGTVVRAEQTANNPTSYKDFLSALHNAEFTKLKLSPRGLQYDGVCPTGKRYTFEFLDGGDDTPASSWATSCAKKEGTFDGDISTVKSLFNAQIPKAQLKALTIDTDFN